MPGFVCFGSVMNERRKHEIEKFSLVKSLNLILKSPLKICPKRKDIKQNMN